MNEKKFLYRNFFLSQSIKSQAHVLTFYAFALQMLLHARYRAYCGHSYRQILFRQTETEAYASVFIVCKGSVDAYRMRTGVTGC